MRGAVIGLALGVILSGALSVGAEEVVVRGGPFSLVDHTGRAVTDRDFRGKFMLIYFGYSSCPDVCPSGLQVMSDAMVALGEDGARVQPIFITFDPERDTPKQLAGYVKYFHPRLIGLTGSKEQALATANAYGVRVSAAYAANAPGLDYSMNPSNYTYLVGPRGRLRLMFKDGISGQAMAASVRRQLEK